MIASSQAGAECGPACPLCASADTRHFFTDDRRAGAAYWRCGRCALTFLDPAALPGRQAEFAHYLTHENDVDDPRYRAFLSRLAGPLMERVPAGAAGLDFGCGPGPALARMLGEAGHRVAVYDPFFAPDPAPLDATYDFITCTEAAEHFHDPAAEFARFDRLLRPGGWLGLMTCFQTDDAGFAKWWYRLDPTHVVFYRTETFAWIAGHFGWSCDIPAKDIALLHKPG